MADEHVPSYEEVVGELAPKRPEYEDTRLPIDLNARNGHAIWTGPMNGGVPTLYRADRSRVSVRRLLYEIRVGPIDSGQRVVTSCDVPKCVRHVEIEGVRR